MPNEEQPSEILPAEEEQKGNEEEQAGPKVPPQEYRFLGIIKS
jgi:hypothetical protein